MALLTEPANSLTDKTSDKLTLKSLLEQPSPTNDNGETLHTLSKFKPSDITNANRIDRFNYKGKLNIYLKLHTYIYIYIYIYKFKIIETYSFNEFHCENNKYS